MSRKSVLLEIPAEAYGMLLASAVLSLLPPLGEIGDALVGSGIPAAVVGARNMWFPGVFPTPRPRPRTTFLRKVWAYALTIFGGFLALVFGLFFHAGATDTSHREIAWPFLIVGLFGLWIAFAGMRRLRWE